MSLSNEEKTNEEWRSIFEDAAESPSDGLWDSIARRLDEEETAPVIPLWPRAKPWVYSVAAAIITLLVGWWATQSIEKATMKDPVAGQTTRPSNQTADKLATQDKPSPSIVPANPAVTQSAQNQKADAARNTNETLAANRPGYVQKNSTNAVASPELERSETAGTIDDIINDQSVLTGSRKTNAEKLPNQELAAFSRRANRPSQPEKVMGPAQAATDLTTPQGYNLARNTARPGEPGNPTTDVRLAYEASYVKTKSTALKKPAPISRIIWYRAPETAIEPQEKGHAKKEYWAALTATPMSFNPMASVHSNINQAYVAMTGVQQSSRQTTVSPIQNQAQISMAWQASSGVQFSKHWSIEAGIQYLNGRSQTRNNASVTNMFTNQTENLLENAIRNSSRSITQLASAPLSDKSSFYPSVTGGNYSNNTSHLAVVPTDQLISNNFQYLQVPVQIGYHILPDRKISYSILGGLMANVFLKNRINDVLEVNPEDQVYRQMSMGGTAGLRINYHPTHHWSGSLTGSYQQALQNGTQSTAQLQIHPQALGVGFGLNYHF